MFFCLEIKLHVNIKYYNIKKGYGFVEFKSEDDADYAIKIMHMVKVNI